MLIYKLLQLLFYDHLSYPINDRWNAQGSLCSVTLWYQNLSNWFGKIASASHPAPYRVKVFPWIAPYGVDSYSINACASATCSHLFESFPNLLRIDRIRLLFLFKNHPQFSLSCSTKRNTSCEALRSSPVSGKIITTTASSAPERNFGISGLPIQVFALFPLHSLSGSPVPQVSPDSVHAILMPDTMQAIIRSLLASCSLAAVNRSISIP
jgi:hypothetical protein